MTYKFTQDWFSSNIPKWKEILSISNPTRLLEIGSFEGRASCFLIEQLANKQNIELHCIDPWIGKGEYDSRSIDFSEVEERFNFNIKTAINNAKFNVAFTKYKTTSIKQLPKFILNKMNYFDFIYIDGCHLSTFVIYDAVLSFYLLKPGGILIFDDYLWKNTISNDPQDSPKLAIESFISVFNKEIKVLHKDWQVILQKK